MTHSLCIARPCVVIEHVIDPQTKLNFLVSTERGYLNGDGWSRVNQILFQHWGVL